MTEKSFFEEKETVIIMNTIHPLRISEPDAFGSMPFSILKDLSVANAIFFKREQICFSFFR